MVQAASSSDSADSYNGDDARRFRHEWNAAVDRYSKATRQNGPLEFSLNTSQATLSAVKVEANVVQAQLVESDARVVGKTFKKSLIPLMLPSCRSSNGLLCSFVFSSDGTTGSPRVGGRRRL